MFIQVSLRKKMLMAFGVGSLLLVGVCGTIYFQVNKTVGSYENILFENVPNLAQFNQMQNSQNELMIPILTMVGDESITKTQAQEAKDKVEKAISDFETARKAYESMSFADGEREIWEKFKQDHWVPFVEISRKLTTLSLSGDTKQFKERDRLYHEEYAGRMEKIKTAFQELKDYQTKSSEQDAKEAKDKTHSLYMTLAFAVIFGVVISQIISLVFSKNLVSSIKIISEHLSKDATELNSASHQLADTSQSLSSSVTEQAAAIQETASSVDEVSAMVSKNAENAKLSQEASSSSRDAAVKGKGVVSEMIESIDAIDQSNERIMKQIETSNQEISEIVKVISEIGEKTKVINDIVFQTKLLSFNASVEAARAGEHGKGFAVVAEEVGNLAQMSGNASKEIAQMLEGSIQKVEGIVSETQKRISELVRTGKEKVDAGARTAKRCGEVLDEIVGNVNRVDQMMGEISSASQEQALGVQEITKAMGQLDQATQLNATSSQQATASVEQLAEQADSLKSAVCALKQIVDGKDLAPEAVVSTAPKAAPSNPKKKVQHTSARADEPRLPTAEDPRFEEV